jgi:hypothetical protein
MTSWKVLMWSEVIGRFEIEGNKTRQLATIGFGLMAKCGWMDGWMHQRVIGSFLSTIRIERSKGSEIPWLWWYFDKPDKINLGIGMWPSFVCIIRPDTASKGFGYDDGSRETFCIAKSEVSDHCNVLIASNRVGISLIFNVIFQCGAAKSCQSSRV